MKTLLLMRHAKSSWNEGVLDDHDRPLNKRGRKTAPEMGRLISAHNLLPDLILCSTALRARETCELVTREWNAPAQARFLDDLYLCPADRFIPILHRVSDDVGRVLIIGHNPGMAGFLESATGFDEKFPTAALAWLTVDLAAWSQIEPQQPMELQNFWRPRDLE
jgi:phosphohistidine phosphatase